MVGGSGGNPTGSTEVPGYGGTVTVTCQVTPGDVMAISIGNLGSSPNRGDASGWSNFGGNAGSVDGGGGALPPWVPVRRLRAAPEVLLFVRAGAAELTAASTRVTAAVTGVASVPQAPATASAPEAAAAV